MQIIISIKQQVFHCRATKYALIFLGFFVCFLALRFCLIFWPILESRIQKPDSEHKSESDSETPSGMKWNSQTGKTRSTHPILRSAGPQINIYIYYHYFVQTCSWPFRFVSFRFETCQKGLAWPSRALRNGIRIAGERYIQAV